MKDYRQVIAYYAVNQKPKLIFNYGTEYALIVLENIFHNAKKHIRIVADYSSFTEFAKAPSFTTSIGCFLEKRKSRLDILVIGCFESIKCLESHSFFEHLIQSRPFKNGRISIKIVGSACFKLKDNPISFCTADDVMYRAEINQVYSQCDFYNKNTSEALQNVFDKVFALLPTYASLNSN